MIDTDNPTLVKIAALLRQAEGTTNEHEAQAFTEKAQQLASLYQIDLAMARSFVPVRERKETPTHKSVWLGERGRKGNDQLVTLFIRVGDANDVRCNIYHDSTGVIAFGFPSDVEVVEMMYASLAVQMVEQANAYLATGEYKKELVWREKRVKDKWGQTYVTHGQFPVDGRMARRSFNSGFTNEISTRLQQARQQAQNETEEARIVEAKALGVEVNPYRDPESDVYDPHGPAAVKWDDEHTQSSSVALVLVRKTEEVGGYYKDHSNARGSWKGSTASNRSGRGYNAGRQAGQNARLSTAKGLSGRGSLPG
jgi:hypothetical protein